MSALKTGCFLLIATVFLLCSVEALKCYTCSSMVPVPQNCDTELPKEPLICPGNLKYCFVERVTKSNGEFVRTTRGCLVKTEEKCATTEEYTQCVLFCETDGCNTCKGDECKIVKDSGSEILKKSSELLVLGVAILSMLIPFL